MCLSGGAARDGIGSCDFDEATTVAVQLTMCAIAPDTECEALGKACNIFRLPMKRQALPDANLAIGLASITSTTIGARFLIEVADGVKDLMLHDVESICGYVEVGIRTAPILKKPPCFKLSRALVTTSRLAFVRHQIWSRSKAQSTISKRT